MGRFLLGVDGGNSKTDYLLYTPEGDFVDVLRTGTCSHEAVPCGFDGMEYTMLSQLTELFNKNGISANDIAAAGFGLAGADLPHQIEELAKRIIKIGIKNFELNNDAILGIKAVLPGGIGLCAVNGSGTAVLGHDETDKTLQISGMGHITGDFAGGSYIFTRIFSRLYEFYYRFGQESSMYGEILDLIECRPENLPVFIGDYKKLRSYMQSTIQIANKHAKAGDSVACEIFDSVGLEIGKSCAGCISKLSFENMGNSENPIGIALVGTIWHKVDYPGMIGTLIKTAENFTQKKCNAILLNCPPAIGGVVWAKEILDGKTASTEFRKKVTMALTIEKYEQMVGIKA